VEQRLLAPAALETRVALPPGPGAVDDPPEAGGERKASTQGHRGCAEDRGRGRAVTGGRLEAGGEAADAVAEPEPERRSHRLHADRG
jgi:hypothetical protein